MPIINGLKFSCEPCIRGHRATGCIHSDRILIEVRKPGRPLESCGHDFSTCKCGKVAALFSVGNAIISPDFSDNETSQSPALGNAEPSFFVHPQSPRQRCEKPKVARTRKEKKSVRNQSRVEKKRMRPEGSRMSPVRRPPRETSFSTVSSSDSTNQSRRTLDKSMPRIQQSNDPAPDFSRLKAPSDPPLNSRTLVEVQKDQQPQLEVREIEPSCSKDAESRLEFPVRQETKYTSRVEDLGRHSTGAGSQHRSQVMKLQYITAGN